jgi:glycopeptide antibiotics resistance protein
VTGSGRTWWWTLAITIAVWLLWMTLRPNEVVAVDLAPLTESGAARTIPAYVLIDLVGNVVVFAPLGATVMLALGSMSAARRLALATLIGSGLSLGIEITQAALPARAAQSIDWMLNTAGTAIGALAGRTIQNNMWRKNRYDRPDDP